MTYNIPGIVEVQMQISKRVHALRIPFEAASPEGCWALDIPAVMINTVVARSIAGNLKLYYRRRKI